MYRIIQGRGTGKTSNLMLTAKANDAVFVCADPYAMKHKAEAYGITGIEFVSYEDFIRADYDYPRVVIDELELFIQREFNKTQLIGYTLTNED